MDALRALAIVGAWVIGLTVITYCLAELGRAMGIA